MTMREADYGKVSFKNEFGVNEYIWHEFTPLWKKFFDWLEWEVRPLLSTSNVFKFYEHVDNSVVLGACLLRYFAQEYEERKETLAINYGLHGFSTTLGIFPAMWSSVIALGTGDEQMTFLKGLKCKNLQQYFERYSPIMISCQNYPELANTLIEFAIGSIDLSIAIRAVIEAYGGNCSNTDEDNDEYWATLVPSRNTKCHYNYLSLTTINFGLFKQRVEEEDYLIKCSQEELTAYAKRTLCNIQYTGVITSNCK